MSATGRNLLGNERRADDFYATPAWCTRAILPHLKRGPVLDPCCGYGAILNVIKDEWPTESRYGIELHKERGLIAQESHAASIRDALYMWESEGDSWPAYQVITNPPYGLAEEFVRQSLHRPGGFTEQDQAFLLRINFLGSQRRAEFHRTYPSDLYVLPKRPSFTDGGTDATEYAWFVWGPPTREGRKGNVTILEI